MTFYFGEPEGDKLMTKINLREIGKRAKLWRHPVRGFWIAADAVRKHGGDILKTPKKDREQFTISLTAMGLKSDSELDFWTHIPEFDPPDGFVMTFREEEKGVWGSIREIEVVEHRNDPTELKNEFIKKLTEKSYLPNTTLVCLGLTPAIYDLRRLAQDLSKIESKIKYVFMVFAGKWVPIESLPVLPEPGTYTLVQLLPIFQQTTFQLQQHFDDFKTRFEEGKECRIIEGNEIHFGTENAKFQKK